MGYFDEIRSFMGKVVDKNCSMDNSENEVDVEEEDDDIIADIDQTPLMKKEQIIDKLNPR